MREKVFSISHKLSAMSLGQDRYRRRYWILPKCGGIFVEGLESAEPDSADPAGNQSPAADEDSRILADAEALSKVGILKVTFCF